MKIKWWLSLVLCVLAIAGLTGCSGGGPAQSASPININAQQGIWVTGQGTVTVTPDVANLSLGVSIQAAKVADAQSQAASAMAKVISVLTSSGVAQKDISTQYYTINPITRYDNVTQQSTITGYQVSNIVNVKIRSIDKVGPIIDAATAAAGDLIRVNGISFSVDNPSQYNSQARTQAMNDAKAKAQQLASLAGVSLGNPIYIVENPASASIPYAVAIPGVASGQAATTPINPGQTDISLTVQVAYSIQ
jgi:uncharacterized protein YggE